VATFRKTRAKAPGPGGEPSVKSAILFQKRINFGTSFPDKAIWIIPIGSMYAAIYGAPWIPSIYPLYVSIYTSTMDPMGYRLQLRMGKKKIAHVKFLLENPEPFASISSIPRNILSFEPSERGLAQMFPTLDLGRGGGAPKKPSHQRSCGGSTKEIHPSCLICCGTGITWY
jgi:hypothetical protein